ncbi:MAG TPA: PAC2 family protein [Candidatus Omnitrophota bacterium]|nr:PAC2 family protein [Candidatus Omnitrophota bacterium]
MEGIKILKRPKLKNPYLLVAWPGMGEVAFKLATYLVDKLKAEEFAEILPADFFYFTGITVQEGVLSLPQLPYSKFYYWKNKKGMNDLIIFISDAQPDLNKSEDYSKKIIQVAKSFKVDTVCGLAAMPVPIDHTQEAKVWFSGTSQELNNALKKYNLINLSSGQVSGMNGLFLGLAKREGLRGFCLLGEIPLYTIQIENPKASLAVLEVLSRILDLKIDFSGLIREVRTMEQEINKLLNYLNIGPQAMQPIGEEEIEKIKKSLSQLTKLPVSIKDKIDKLFQEAKDNLQKANELKLELDKWSVYKEYEDRFLDLFKKAKGNSN